MALLLLALVALVAAEPRMVFTDANAAGTLNFTLYPPGNSDNGVASWGDIACFKTIVDPETGFPTTGSRGI